jgi:hypothetical protein
MWIYEQICAYVCAWIYTYEDIVSPRGVNDYRVHLYSWMLENMYDFMYVYIYRYLSLHVSAYVYIYIYIYVYDDIYIYVYDGIVSLWF